MKKGRIKVATFQRKDDQQYTVSERVFETVPRCLDEPLPVAQAVRAERKCTKNTLYKNRHPPSMVPPTDGMKRERERKHEPGSDV
jgi:hypothetical protein